MVPNDGEKRRPVFLQLDRADAVQAGEAVERVRPGLCHFDQRPVWKDHVGRLLLRRRDRAAQPLQRRKQRAVRLVWLGGGALRPPRFGA